MNNDHETLMAQYLLGDLPENERLRLEEEFFRNDEAFESLKALEDELAYDYAQGTLSDIQRKQFEQRFLQSPQQSTRIALAQAVLESVANVAAKRNSEVRTLLPQKPSFLQVIGDFFRLQSSGLQAGLATACLLLLLGGSWLLFQTVRLRNQVDKLEVARVEQEQQRIQLEQLAKDQRLNSEKLNTELENERRRRSELQQEIERQKKGSGLSAESPDQAGLPSFLLLPGLSRDIDSTPRLSIPATGSQIRLQLKLKRPGVYRSYQLILQDLDGKTLWQRISPVPGITLSSKLLPPGDYLLLLKARSDSGPWVEVDEYHFSTTR